MAKVICDGCETSFLYEVVKGLENCPVCGKPLWVDSDTGIDNSEKVDDSQNEILSFGEGIKLGENDSFDADKIDFWWYSIREPKTLGENDDGEISTTCTSCGRLREMPYHLIAKVNDFLLLDPRMYERCSNCEKELRNHILSKRPADWVDPRKHDICRTDYENVPKCPICGSTKIHKISMTNKAVSAIAFGLLAAGHVGKTYKCDVCGAKF